MEKEEILELINAGFAPELIELEFNVPLEKINKYISQEEKRKAAEAENQKAAQLKKQHDDKKRSTANTPKKQRNVLDILRQNYRRVMSNQALEISPTAEISTYKKPTEAEQDRVNQAIAKLQDQATAISKMSSSEKREKRTTLINMLNELKSINSLPKTIEQLKELQKIFDSRNLENLSTSHDDKINLKLSKTRKSIIEELATVIEQMASQTSDFEELLNLSKQLPTSGLNFSNFHAGSIKNRLDNRISQLRNAQIMYNIRNNVSPEVESILKSIADNTFDLNTARETISKEAQKRVDSAPKTKFALTKERQEKQVEIQIRTIIAEQGKKYPISDPEATINNLMLLFAEKNMENSFAKVVENLTSQEKYEEAKELCKKYISRPSFDEAEAPMSKRARQAYKEVVLVQIGNMITEQIKKPSNPEEDKVFMELLEQRIQKERLSLNQIVIGITASGNKKITLNDIWYTNTKQK